jgi:hypothetical protein
MLYRRTTAVSQISFLARDLNLADKAVSLSRESLRLAVELHDTEIPETHVDYDTYVRAVIYGYQNLGTIIAQLIFTTEARAEAKMMFEKSLKLSEQLFFHTRRESSQVGALVKDSLMLLLSLAEIENDGDSVFKYLPHLKRYENLLTDDDRKSVIYYESKYQYLKREF